MLSLQPADLDAIRLSLKVATAATLLSTPLGIGVAWLLVHTRIPGKSLFDAARDASNEISAMALRARPLAIRLRDGVARLFTPIL